MADQPLLHDFPPMLWVVSIGAGLLLLLFIIAIGMLLRHLGRSRELLHVERLKALESGHAPVFAEPDRSREQYGQSAFWIAFWLGAGVPLGTAWAAAAVMIQGNVREFAIVLGIWICVAVLGVASVVCATVLMGNCRRSILQDRGPARRDSIASDAR